jgi:hypothetical protein
MLIIEIVLTIFAWRKGWRWLALIPTALALCIGLLLGIGIAASGGSVSAPNAATIIIDVLAIIALIVMVTKGPKSKETNE